MASAFESLAASLKTVFDTEFTAEGFTMEADRLHESLGRYSVAVGVSPIEERAVSNNRLVSEHWIFVQFYGLWDDAVDPTTQVDPSVITGYAERFKSSLRVAQATDPHTDMVWFFDVDRIQYPNDPTGNKTRFEATIRAFGNNSNLVETSA